MRVDSKKCFFSLALIFSLVACESAVDVARKPELVEPMIKDSIEVCETGPVKPDNEQYATRLREVLMAVQTKNLEVIRDNGVTVCLDQRLSHLSPQENRDRDDVASVFYGGIPPVFSMRDDGRMPGETASFWVVPKDFYTAKASLRRLAYKIKEGQINSQATSIYAEEKRMCGNHYYCYSWEDQSKRNVLIANPELKTAPLRVKCKGS